MVHPECIGERHYSDDHGTGSAIKMAKAPDVDMAKGDGQAAPDPTVANALEKARDTGVPSKKGQELKPNKGKMEKMPYEGRNDNYPKGYTERKVPIKGMSLNQTPKGTHQTPMPSQHPTAPDGRALNATKPHPPSKVTMEEKNAPYREAKENTNMDMEVFRRAADIYNAMPGSKGNWTPELFRTMYTRMYDPVKGSENYKADNPAFRDAVRTAYDNANDIMARQHDMDVDNQRAMRDIKTQERREALERSFEAGRSNPEDPSKLVSIEESDRNRKKAEEEEGMTEEKPQKRVQTEQTTELTPAERRNRSLNREFDSKKTLTPNPRIPKGKPTVLNPNTGKSYESKPEAVPYKDDTLEGARTYQDKKMSATQPDISQKDAEYVKQATGGLGTPDAVKLSEEQLARFNIKAPRMRAKDASKGLSADTGRATDRRSAYTPPKPKNNDPIASRQRDEDMKPVELKVDKPNEGEIMTDENKSARTDVPSFDELRKSNVKDLTMMWNELMKSSDAGDASDEMPIGTDMEKSDGDPADTSETDGKESDSDPVPDGFTKSEETNTVEQPNVIQKSFKEIMDEGTMRKIGTMGAPAGSNPYGYHLGGNGMPIQNGYRQVFISREDRVMPTIGQMKHTRN